jgi:cell filamentation protein
MIEHTDITIVRAATLKNKLGITDPQELATAEAALTGLRLAELRSAPIRGGFDSLHLQEIHRHVYQDVYDWAGQLRHVDAGEQPGSEVVRSLNTIFDRLGRENHLKGRSPDEWSHSASAYIYDLGIIQPFIAGNEVALCEFAEELARRNNLALQWQRAPESSIGEVVRRLQQFEQSTNIRRMVMLATALDATVHPSRNQVLARGIERFFFTGDLF